MFDIGWTELMVIAVVAIVVIGPKDLPRVMRMVGQWTGKLKRMGREFQGQFNEALREAELEDVRKDVVAIGKDLKEGVTQAGADINKGLAVSEASIAAPSAEPASPGESAPASETPAEAVTPAEAPTPTPAPVPVEVAAPAPEPATAAAGEVKP